MKKKTTLELVEQSAKVSLYSISFLMDRMTEFELFLRKFEEEAYYNEDYQRILYALSIILERGAVERYFRPEGKINDDLCALPIESGRIRLFCLRISDEVLILGNGDIKRTAAYDDEQYERVCNYFVDRFYYREISMLPFKIWANFLLRKIKYELAHALNGIVEFRIELR